MKSGLFKTGLGFVLFFSLLTLILLNPNKTQAQEVKTVVYNSCASTTEELLGSNYLTQTFVPSVDTIVNVGVMVRNAGAVSVKYNLALTSPQGQIIASRPQSLIPSESWPYQYINPQYPLTVEPTGQYALWIYPYQGYETNQLYIRGSGQGLENCYPNGTAFKNLSNLHRDFSFVVFGYNSDSSPPAEVSGDGSAPPSQNDLAVVTSEKESVSDVPEAKKTTSSKPASGNEPQNLSLSYDNTDQSVDLRWDSSNLKDIAIYEISRADNSESDFTKIGEVAGDKLNWSDSNISFGHTYAYYVTAVTANTRSDNSNTVSITIKDQGLLSTPSEQNLTFWQAVKNNLIQHSLILLFLALLLVLALYKLLLIEKKKLGHR